MISRVCGVRLISSRPEMKPERKKNNYSFKQQKCDFKSRKILSPQSLKNHILLRQGTACRIRKENENVLKLGQEALTNFVEFKEPPTSQNSGF